MRKLASYVLATCLFGMAAVPASAETARKAVSYNDLDLTTAEGMDELGHRIEAAIASLCVRPDLRSFQTMAAWKACRGDAQSAAMEQLDRIASTEQLAYRD
ncbi:UrcA family protein [Altericroceibacterium xinjiangense]|uniref:UrcA family protein n=1 Tax=Altericroceibacterium xinjiangense TaxID=762261 RepID=UPI000F7E18CB|nr:UrcA family protein [Altericroceibacterium xinjiangense]